MDAAELQTCLKTLGWSNRALAKRLGVPKSWVDRRVWGEVALEEPLGAWLEQLALLVVLYPPPPIERRQRASAWPSEPVLEGWTDDWKA